MCLALPARVVALEGEDATVDLGGVRKRVNISLVPEARVGDHVIVHVGHAIGLVDPEEAARTLALFAQAGLTTEMAAETAAESPAAPAGARA
jgi:hydrogenase expression/formation protein HypC